MKDSVPLCVFVYGYNLNHWCCVWYHCHAEKGFQVETYGTFDQNFLFFFLCDHNSLLLTRSSTPLADLQPYTMTEPPLKEVLKKSLSFRALYTDLDDFTSPDL